MVTYMKYIKANTLSCFSPPVMIATFVIEIALALYVSWRYKFDEVTRLTVAILFCLALFQLAEWNVCEGAFGIDSLSWSRLGYVAITMLPPLGFHLATKLAGDRRTAMVATGYLAAAGFATFFAFTGHGLVSQMCLGNYVIFKTAPAVIPLYAAYYYGWLMLGTVYAVRRARQIKQANRAAALRALAWGYVAFIAPTTLANIIDPSTIAGIPSIMCGFAVLLAIILSGEVLPQYYRRPVLRSYFSFNSPSSHGKTSQ